MFYFRSMAEVKEEIQQIINRLPDEVLSNVWQYLKQIENSSKEEIEASIHFRKILTEDKNLLHRLAK